MKETLEDIFDLTMEVNTGGLQCIVLGPSKAGKSHLVGTYPGKVLYLCGDGERHGVKSAFKEGGENIIPICWGRRKDGSLRSPDAAYKFINGVISEVEQLKAAGIRCVAIDSLTDLIPLVRETQEFANRCLTDKGKHNSFAEPDAYIGMLFPIMSHLRTLTESHGIDHIILSDLEIQEQADNGEILRSKPRFPSFKVAESIVGKFQDVLMLGRMKTKQKAGPVLQMGAGCSRVSKNESGVITKTIDFTPCLADVKGEIPPLIKADLAEILKMKGR